jgi:hypothetical protein
MQGAVSEEERKACCCQLSSVCSHLAVCLTLSLPLRVNYSWHNHLNPDVVKGGWTEEEDAIILRMQAELGNQWAKITKMLPGR